MSHLPPPPPALRDRLLASNGSSSAPAELPATTPRNQPSQRRAHYPYNMWQVWRVYAPPALSSMSAAAATTPTSLHASATVPKPLRQQPQGVSVNNPNLYGIQKTHDAAQMTQELKMIPHSVTGLLTEGARLVEASLLPPQPLDSPNPLRTDGTRPTTVAAPLHRRLVSVTNIYYGAFDGDLWKVAHFLNGLVNTVVCPAAASTSPFLILFSPRNRQVTKVKRAKKHLFQFQVEVYSREPSTASIASSAAKYAESFADHILNYYGRHVRVIYDHDDVLWIHDSGMFGGDATIGAIGKYVGSLRSIVDNKTRHARMQALPPATMGIKKYYPLTGGLIEPP